MSDADSRYEPFAHSLMEYRADLSALSPTEHGQVIKLNEQLESHGFFAPVIQILESEDDYRVVTATWFYLERDIVARVVLSEATKVPAIILLSEFDDGSFLLSTPTRAFDSAPESLQQNALGGADVAVLMPSHRRKLAALLKNVVQIESADEVYGLLERYHQTWRQHARTRIPNSEVSSGTLPRTPDDEKAFAIVAEMRRLQQPKAGGGFMILIVSLVFFVGLGQGFDDWNWRTMGLIVPIILFHELGHFVAMKVFGYRNLKMFFIPLFGAAVTGKQYNVPGWKRAIVSLAGPVPGIALAAALVVVDKHFQVPHARWIIIELAVINGLNLLPILPLDGGWVVSTLFFSRHPSLYGLFQFVTAILAVLLAFVLKSIFLGFIAVTMLIGLPLGLKLERLARTLRNEGLAAAPGDDTVSDEVGLRIARELRPLLPATLTATQMAPSGLTVFERLNTRPPGILATGALSAVHAIAFLMAIIVPFADAHIRQERQAVAGNDAHQSDWRCGDTASTTSLTEDVAPDGTIIASFETAQAAQQWNAQYDWTMTDPLNRLAIGRSLMISVSTRNRFLEDELRTAAKHVFYTKTADITVHATAPEGANANRVANELRAYFAFPHGHVIEPWNTTHTIDEPAAKMRALRVRYNVEVVNAVQQDPRVMELQTQAEAKLPRVLPHLEKDAADGANPNLNAADQQAVQEWQQLTKKRIELAKQVQAELFAQLLSSVETENEREFLQLCHQPFGSDADDAVDNKSDEDDGNAYLQSQLKLGKFAGQLPLAGDTPSARETRLSAFGRLDFENRQLRLVLRLNRPEYALPAIADYLCRNGYTLDRYEIQPQHFDGE